MRVKLTVSAIVLLTAFVLPTSARAESAPTGYGGIIYGDKIPAGTTVNA